MKTDMTRIFTVIIVVFLFGCNNAIDNKSDVDSTIKVENVKNYQDFLDDYSIVEILPLETNKESLLAEIEEIFIYKNRIYVHTWIESESLLCFSNKGKFLFEVGGEGKGPGEYIQPTCTWIGETNGTEFIQIHDGFSRKNLFYDINNGKFIKDESTDNIILHNSKQVGNYIIALQAWRGLETRNRLIICEQSPLTIRYSGLESKSEFDLLSNRGAISEPFNNEHVLFATGAEDIIHEISPIGVTKQYWVDFGNKSIPESEKLEFDFDNIEEDYFSNNKGKYFTGISDLCETSDHILFSFTDYNQAYFAAYNKKNKTCVSYKTPLDASNYSLNAFPCPVATLGDTLVSFISPYSIDSYNKDNKLFDITIDELDNPILIKYIKRAD